ncbi:TolC family protein [Bacteroidota bacterium]
MNKLIIYSVVLLSFVLQGNAQVTENKKTSFTLAEAQAFAIENNLNVENARLDLESARQRVWENTAMGLPQISAGASYTNNLQLMTQLIPDFIGGTDEMLELQFGTQHNASANIVASQLLFSGPYIVGLQAASTYKDLTQKSLDKQEADIKEAVAQSYYSILLAEAGRDAFGKNLETMKTRLTETKAMYQTGFLEETDVDQIQIAVSTLENEYIAAKQLVDISYKFLVYRMGYDLDSNIVITEILQDIIAGLTNDLLQQEFNVNRHYDYRIIDTQEKLAFLQVKMNKYEFMPTLSAYLNHQQMAMRNSFNFMDGNEKWFPSTMLGINLEIPVFASGMRKAKIGQSKIELEKAKNIKEDLSNALELQVQQARIGFRTAYQKYLNERSNIVLSQRIFDRTSSKYKSGLVSSLEMTIATEQLTGSQTGYISVMVELLNAKLALDKSLGNI